MLLQQITESISRRVAGAKYFASDPHDPKYVSKMIHSYRARIIERDFSRTGVINPICLQRFYLSYSGDLNINPQYKPNFVLFNVPPVTSLVDEDGIRYIGSIDQSKAWIRLKSRGEMANYNKHPFTRIDRQCDIYVLYDGTNGRIEVYNDPSVTEGMIEGIFANPTEIPTWNEYTDPYPLNDDAISEIEEMIFVQSTSISASKPPSDEFNQPKDKPLMIPRQESQLLKQNNQPNQ